MRLYQQHTDSGAVVTILRMSGAEAGSLAHLLCVARGQGLAESATVRVIVDNAPAEPRPAHEAVEP